MAAAARTYADFVPPHNLVEEADNQTLVVDLSGSGFKKEQLRVQVDSYGRLLISGERQEEGGDRWIRFRKELHVPDSCNAGDIRARFDKDGVLHITMPLLRHPSAADAHQTAAAARAEKDEKKHRAAAAEEDDDDGGGMERRSPAGRGEVTAQEEDGRMDACTGRLTTFAVVRDRRRTVLLAMALAVVGAAGLYARYWLMDPAADHVGALSDH